MFNLGNKLKTTTSGIRINENFLLSEDIDTSRGAYLCLKTECLLYKAFYKVLLYEAENWRKLIFNTLIKTFQWVPMMTCVKMTYVKFQNYVIFEHKHWSIMLSDKMINGSIWIWDTWLQNWEDLYKQIVEENLVLSWVWGNNMFIWIWMCLEFLGMNIGK